MFRSQPYITADFLAVFKNDDGRNGHYAVFYSKFLFFINVYFADDRFAVQVIGEFFDDGGENFSWIAAGDLEIDQDRCVCLKHLVIKCIICKMFNCHNESLLKMCFVITIIHLLSI